MILQLKFFKTPQYFKSFKQNKFQKNQGIKANNMQAVIRCRID